MESIAAGDAADTDTRKLVILGLPWDTTEASLEQYFSQLGPLQVIFVWPKHGQISRVCNCSSYLLNAGSRVMSSHELSLSGLPCQSKLWRFVSRFPDEHLNV